MWQTPAPRFLQPCGRITCSNGTFCVLSQLTSPIIVASTGLPVRRQATLGIVMRKTSQMLMSSSLPSTVRQQAAGPGAERGTQAPPGTPGEPPVPNPPTPSTPPEQPTPPTPTWPPSPPELPPEPTPPAVPPV